jgi:hypothetical protein
LVWVGSWILKCTRTVSLRLDRGRAQRGDLFFGLRPNGAVASLLSFCL